MRKLIGLATAFALLTAMPVSAGEARPFVDQTVVDLTTILPPPPADDSAETRQELAQVLAVQATRTPAMVARAQADAEETVWRFADVVGPKFRRASLPVTAAFFARVDATGGAIVGPAKKAFKRPRPGALSDLVRPVIEQPRSNAYPSGHATVGMLMGIVLSAMLPEKRAAIMARAKEFGENRVVAGVHFPSDVEEGRVAGAVIAATLLQRDDFRSEFNGARTELRAALGL